MTTVALGEAKDKLSEYVTSVERTHDRIVVTRHGRPLSLSLPTTWLPSRRRWISSLRPERLRRSPKAGLTSMMTGWQTTTLCAPDSIEDEPALRRR
jgi:antitoxin YefM